MKKYSKHGNLIQFSSYRSITQSLMKTLLQMDFTTRKYKKDLAKTCSVILGVAIINKLTLNDFKNSNFYKNYKYKICFNIIYLEKVSSR